GMRGGAGVGRGETAQARDIPGQLQDSAVIDLVEHRIEPVIEGRQRRCAGPLIEYIGIVPPVRADGEMRGERVPWFSLALAPRARGNGKAACGPRAWAMRPDVRMVDAAAPVTLRLLAGRTERPRWTQSSSLGRSRRPTNRNCPITCGR